MAGLSPRWRPRTLNCAVIERFVQMLIDQPIDLGPRSGYPCRAGRPAREAGAGGVSPRQWTATPQTTRARLRKSLTSVLVGAARSRARGSGQNPGLCDDGEDASRRSRSTQASDDAGYHMASGFIGDDRDPKAPGNEDVMVDQEAQLNFMRSTPLMAAALAGTALHCSTNPNLAGGVLSRVRDGRTAGEQFRLADRPADAIRPYALTICNRPASRTRAAAHTRPRDYEARPVDAERRHLARQAHPEHRLRSVSTEPRGERQCGLHWLSLVGIDLPGRAGVAGPLRRAMAARW